MVRLVYTVVCCSKGTYTVIPGSRPPRPTYTPSVNGHVRHVTGAGRQGGQWPSGIQDMLSGSWSRVYAMACGVTTLLLITLLLMFYFLVQQGSVLWRLTDAVRDKEANTAELSLLIQQLQQLTRNLTATRGPT
ncbi:uncharacterized protein si:dkey-20d21.12 isoform X2 [Nerophis ophidion]|uniref:uncharacterized protein si:dkey-20d21.12 isoform X2 n=1 Tax=Nerophis ophidion TaxID=159077 RepID=UPI002ADF0CD3|nr:uncharacterized protein si:dkey-20d21.12 isoform X2 [Nerophis ophidion]XP_061745328.1 uncharacterized protein si:dkey-20d21.12 isoform X2 [Nerophis ophidion]